MTDKMKYELQVIIAGDELNDPIELDSALSIPKPTIKQCGDVLYEIKKHAGTRNAMLNFKVWTDPPCDEQGLIVHGWDCMIPIEPVEWHDWDNMAKGTLQAEIASWDWDCIKDDD